MSAFLFAVFGAGFIALADQAGADCWALVVSSVSIGGSILLILPSGGYLARLLARPVRRVPAIAGGVAGQDLSGRASAESAALRRVATLIAREVSPSVLFGTVAAEAGGVLRADATALVRFERDRAFAVVGTWEKPAAEGVALPLGSRWPAEDDTAAALIQRTGEPARVASYESGIGAKHEWARTHDIRSSVASPIVVNGQLWGALSAFYGPALGPDDTEMQLLGFSQLVALAIASGQSRARLEASRARVMATSDQTRRRIERELHDRTQQRLISLALELRAAESHLPPEVQRSVQQWPRTAQGLTDAAEELRRISQDLYPAVLDRCGLESALRSVARRAGVPVRLTMQVPDRLPQRVEVAAHYAVAEALAHGARQAGASASAVEVDVRVLGDDLRLQVSYDGMGGRADAARGSGFGPTSGSGLIGLRDRVEAAGGRVEIASPAENGTTVLASIPLTPA